MYFLVTGGAGFIGSHIVQALLEKGERVRVLDNFASGKRENLEALGGDLEVIEGDLRDSVIVQRAVQKVQFVLHQGALPSVQRSIQDPATTFEVNTRGTLNLLLAAREAHVQRVVYASSSSIYGDNPALPKQEDMLPAPKSPYAASKLAGEFLCQVFSQVYGLETVILRYFNIFGPRQDPASPYAAVIPKFINAMLKGEKPVIYGDGNQSRDFTYIANVVAANLAALDAEEVSGEVFNIACGARYRVLDLVAALNEILGKGILPTHADPRPGDVRHSQADISKARRALGYTVAVDFLEGLRRTVAWHKAQASQTDRSASHG